MLVPHDNERVRSFHLSGTLIRAGVSLLLVALLLFGTFAIGFFIKQSEQIHSDRLKRENVLLAAEVDEMRGQMQALSQSLETLSEKEQTYRMIAGLPEAGERADAAQPESGASHATLALYRMNPAVGQKVFVTSSNLNQLINRAEELGSGLDEALVTMKRNGERLAATPSIAPSDGALTSLFSRGRKHPVLRVTRPHKGIDIAARVGEPILAPAAGTVRYAAFRSGGYGNTVEINHGYGYVTRFAHASRLLVKVGQRVERGTAIAEVGATGLVSGPHLHYEVEVNGKPVDPLNFIISDELPD